MTKQEFFAGIFVLFLGLAAVIYSVVELNLGNLAAPGPGMFPFLSGIGIVVLTLVWVGANIKKITKRTPLWGKNEWVNPIILVILTIAYIVLLEYAGYIISTLLFVFGWQMLIEHRKISSSLLTAGLCTAALYLVFVIFLRVPLPEGILNF